MDTPICDFVRRYQGSGALRMHMPGHKGNTLIGPEALDITEIEGADVLYRARGVIRQSEENAAALFGAGRTLYSTEGSSLCIRAMLYLALLRAREKGLPPVLLCGRNAHRALPGAAALLDVDVQWIWGDSLLSCPVGEKLEAALNALKAPPMAVYVTAPDYLGNLENLAPVADICHARGVPLLVDNAHGAYLRFLPEDRHPLTLGADLCCDSAHKTLPCLTGAAYLHVGKSAPALFAAQAERALALFASTSPSYLTLQSLDAANRLLAEDFRAQLADFLPKLDALKARLQAKGWTLAGREPMKLTLCPKPFGYTGEELHNLIRAKGIEAEFADPDFLVLLPAPATGEAGLARLEEALASVPRRAAIPDAPPPLPHPRRAMSLREALLSPQREVPAEEALGRVLADAHVA
ncbi:MAG: amino acid decarboxylase, partial [Clostridia bacterium]|nr:amino acid decarboxylase [Clostridia bacterium]